MFTAVTDPTRPVSAIAPAAIGGTARRILHRIRNAEINLALWERTLPAEAADFCAKLAVRSSALDLDLTGAPGSMLPLLAATALFTRAADDAPAHWLLEDIASLADEFGQLADCAEVRVRLTKVSDDGCAAFHVDNLLLRVLCTYAGKGAQWAAEADVRRAELGLCFCSAAEANAAIVPDAGSVRTMPTGAVAIFKGRLWPGAERRGLVHRSHPVCCGEHARLRLTIDPVGSRYRSSRENPDSRMSLPPMRADPLRKEAEVE
jgi:hypothetical protein